MRETSAWRTSIADAEPGGSDRHVDDAVTVSVVIPTLNEAANLPHVLTQLPPIVTEVLLVDGHSIDDTIAVARAIRPDIRVLLQNRRGKGNALACGFAAATGEIIVMLDGDGSTDPAEIPRFVDALLAGSDFAKGSRFATGGHSVDLTHIRRLGNRALSIAVNLLFGTRYTDLCYGYNAFWRHCLPHMSVTSSGFEVETLINVRIARAGLNVTEVASIEHERIHGESKLNAMRDGIRALRVIVRERVRRVAVHGGAWEPVFRELPPSTEPDIRPVRAVRADGTSLDRDDAGVSRLETASTRSAPEIAAGPRTAEPRGTPA
jgi:glycosyltransferase involved in cell wall biosynthesis